MLVVGLTGGIASGKTTVSDLFAERGAAIVDADVIGRSMLDPGQPGYQLLLERLGNEILGADGTINRPALRQSVFNQAELKQWLEQKLHPLIYQACQDQIKASEQYDYVMLVVPLMFETDFHQLAGRFCVIDCPTEVQLKRLMQRDGIDHELATRMLNSQMGNDKRLARADDIISNSGSLEDLAQQVHNLHSKYVAIATSQSA